MNMLEYITHKDTQYSWEQEVRAVATQPIIDMRGLSDCLFELMANPELHVFAPPVELKRLVQGVVLHPDATAEFIAGVELLCAEHGLPRPEPSRFS